MSSRWLGQVLVLWTIHQIACHARCVLCRSGFFFQFLCCEGACLAWWSKWVWKALLVMPVNENDIEVLETRTKVITTLPSWDCCAFSGVISDVHQESLCQSFSPSLVQSCGKLPRSGDTSHWPSKGAKWGAELLLLPNKFTWCFQQSWYL